MYKQKETQLGKNKVYDESHLLEMDKPIKDTFSREELPSKIINLCKKYQISKGYNALDFETNKSDLKVFLQQNL